MENKMDNKQIKNDAITRRSEDFAQWYTDICKKAELMDYSSVKGFIIYRPYGYAIWEEIQNYLNKRFKETGHQNVYMPTVIPESLFNKEKEIDINDSLNKIVYLEVDSPLNYGMRTWEFYGRIVKVTKCYFEIINYCTADVDNWNTEQILIKEQEQTSKKWAKKSIRKLYEVKTEERTEEKEYYKN